jgi:hypothetical protein
VVVRDSLFIAGGDAPKLLEAIHQALNPIALAVEGTIQGTCTTFVPLARDG